jgi:hypothetical protein
MKHLKGYEKYSLLEKHELNFYDSQIKATDDFIGKVLVSSKKGINPPTNPKGPSDIISYLDDVDGQSFRKGVIYKVITNYNRHSIENWVIPSDSPEFYPDLKKTQDKVINELLKIPVTNGKYSGELLFYDSGLWVETGFRNGEVSKSHCYDKNGQSFCKYITIEKTLDNMKLFLNSIIKITVFVRDYTRNNKTHFAFKFSNSTDFLLLHNDSIKFYSKSMDELKKFGNELDKYLNKIGIKTSERPHHYSVDMKIFDPKTGGTIGYSAGELISIRIAFRLAELILKDKYEFTSGRKTSKDLIDDLKLVIADTIKRMRFTDIGQGKIYNMGDK